MTRLIVVESSKSKTSAVYPYSESAPGHEASVQVHASDVLTSKLRTRYHFFLDFCDFGAGKIDFKHKYQPEILILGLLATRFVLSSDFAL